MDLSDDTLAAEGEEGAVGAGTTTPLDLIKKKRKGEAETLSYSFCWPSL